MTDAVAKAIDPAAGVVEAELRDHNLDDAACKSIAAFLRTPECKIQLLNLSSNGICDSGAVEIANALKVNKTLINLNLSQNKIGDRGAEEFAGMLENNTTLKLLNLRANQIERTGYELLRDVLDTNSTLKRIMLEFNRISPEAEATA